MQVRSVAAIPLSRPPEEGRSFGHARGLTSPRSATLVRVETADGTVGCDGTLGPYDPTRLEEPFDPTGRFPNVPAGPGLGVTVDEDAVERYRIER